jgi:hypothetical protein
MGGCFAMIKPILSILVFAVLASSGATAAEIARMAPAKAKTYPLARGACWWAKESPAILPRADLDHDVSILITAVDAEGR